MQAIFGAARKPKTKSCYLKVGAARKPKTCYLKVGAARKPKTCYSKEEDKRTYGITV